MLTTESLIISTIEMADIELANIGLGPLKLTGDGTLEPVLSVENRNLLILMCTKAACLGAFDNVKAIELLEFALARGSNVDCGVPGVKASRAINTAIEHHRTEILDWFIDKEADLNARDAQGNYPLHHMIVDFRALTLSPNFLPQGQMRTHSKSEKQDQAIVLFILLPRLPNFRKLPFYSIRGRQTLHFHVMTR
jgi:hypothetical protein